jgi:hypothetical protein
MSALTVALLIFGCVFGGALLGLLLRGVLPGHHLSAESKDVVKMGTGLIGTMAALVLGLLVASAKSSYDSQANELTEASARVLMLDRVLAHYGPEARDARELLRQAVSRMIERLWATDAPTSTRPTTAEGEALYDSIQQLAPANEAQRAVRAQAQQIALDLGRTRMLLYAQQGSSISVPFLVVVVSWITIIFISFGLFAPRNLTVIITLLLCALSVAGAMFLILELDHPFQGLIQLSDAPLRNALSLLGS